MVNQYNYLTTQEAELPKKQRQRAALFGGVFFFGALFFGYFLFGIKRTRSLTETNKKIIMNEVKNVITREDYVITCQSAHVIFHKTPVNFFFKITGFIRLYQDKNRNKKTC